MKAKKYLIADMAVIFLFAALLIAAGVYYCITVDPFAFMYDGTLDDTGVAGLILILVLGLPALIIKLLIYIWIIFGVLFFLFGIAVAIVLISKSRIEGLYVCLNIYTTFSCIMAGLSFLILLISGGVLVAAKGEDSSFTFILTEIMYLTFEIALVSVILNILTAKELRNVKLY